MNQQYKLFQQVIDALPIHLYWTDKNTRIVGANIAQARDFGDKTVESCIGKNSYDFAKQLGWSKEFADHLNQEHFNIIKTGIGSAQEYTGVLADNKEHIFLSQKSPITIDGDIVGIVGFSIDITERKKMESQLREAAIKEKKEQEEHIRTMRIFAGGIAHELRTPLAAMVNAAGGIVKFMPRLVEGYKAAKEADLDVPLIRNDHLEILKDTAEHIAHEGEYAQSVITATLVTAQTAEIDTTKFITLSMVEIILAALTTFYYQNEEDKALVHFNNENDFQFRGDATLMMNIMYNLLKNAIFFVHKAGKGEITIWLEKQKDKNLVYVKDTSFGIPKENLLRIFEGYFTTRDTGTGVGLPLVRRLMHAFEGEITCESVEGEYTTFTLTFPVVADE